MHKPGKKQLFHFSPRSGKWNKKSVDQRYDLGTNVCVGAGSVRALEQVKHFLGVDKK